MDTKDIPTMTFKTMVDDLLDTCKDDAELEDALIWVSRRALNEGTNIYNELYDIIRKYDLQRV